MSKEIITLQLGQCGNQIGAEFWQRLCLEHGIAPNGIAEECADQLNDNKKVFFYESDKRRYVPRAVLIDLEPRVINTILNSTHSKLYDRDNVYIPKDGGSTGNNWAAGYGHGEKLEERLIEMLDSRAECCDTLEGFLFCHSVAGGTGSGMGSFLMELCAEHYRKAVIHTYSIFPNYTESSDVVIQPYNTLLTLSRLATAADSVVVIDNSALNRIAYERMQIDKPDPLQINKIVATIMSVSTLALRYPSCMHSTLLQLTNAVIPTPNLHFLIAGYAPLNSVIATNTILGKTSVSGIMKRLLQPKNMLVSCMNEVEKSHGYLGILDIILGKVEHDEINQSLERIRESQLVKFVPWTPASIQVAPLRLSPFVESKQRVSGLMLANHTNISTLFRRTLREYDRLRNREAFLNIFRREKIFENDFNEMNVSRESLVELIKEYNAAKNQNYS